MLQLPGSGSSDARVERDEVKARELLEQMMHPIRATIIEKPVSGKALKVNEVWEL